DPPAGSSGEIRSGFRLAAPGSRPDAAGPRGGVRSRSPGQRFLPAFHRPGARARGRRSGKGGRDARYELPLVPVLREEIQHPMSGVQKRERMLTAAVTSPNFDNGSLTVFASPYNCQCASAFVSHSIHDTSGSWSSAVQPGTAVEVRLGHTTQAPWTKRRYGNKSSGFGPSAVKETEREENAEERRLHPDRVADRRRNHRHHRGYRGSRPAPR